MPTIIDANSILHEQYKKGFIKKEDRAFSFFRDLEGSIPQKFSFDHKLAKSIHEQLTTSLIYANGLLADIRENIQEKQYEMPDSPNFSGLIKSITSIIDVYVTLELRIEQFIKKGLGDKYTSLKYVPETVSQTISLLYAALRILKKANAQQSVAVSGQAKEAASHSLHSLKYVLNGH